MKRMVRAIALVMILVFALASLTGCGKNKEEITNLLTEFEYACNTLDVNAILECITPKKADTIKLALGIYGMFTDKDTNEVLNDISERLIGDFELDGNDFFSSIKIAVDDIAVEDEDAIAYTTVEYKINGADYKKPAEFKCVYYMEKWYVSKFDLK